MNGLDQKKSDELCDMYNELLANLAISRQNLYHFHWSLTGPFFFELHGHFAELYDAVGERIDLVAERIRALSNKVLPEHRFSEYFKISTIKETKTTKVSEMVSIVVKDLEVISGIERKIIEKAQTFKDEATITMVGEFLLADEKASWMYRSFKTL